MCPGRELQPFRCHDRESRVFLCPVLKPIFNLKGTSATHEINAKVIYIALLFLLINI